MGLSDRNDCLYNRCYNGGTCYDLYKRFKCVCAPGYDGNHCQNKSKELSNFHFHYLTFKMINLEIELKITQK